MKNLLNLQMFADDEDDGEELVAHEGSLKKDAEEVVEVDVDEDEDDVEVDVEDEELEDDTEKPDKKVLTKAEKAIIKYKQEAKDLRQKLQEREQADVDKELEVAEAKRVNQLTKQGLSSEEAEVKAKDESEMKRLRMKLTTMELDKLETKYAGISSYAKKLSEDKSKFPEFSYEQLYLANYSKESSFDKKTQMEQELLHNKAKGQSKTLEDGKPSGRETIKMTQSDLRAYTYAKSKKSGLTKKQFMENLYGDLE